MLKEPKESGASGRAGWQEVGEARGAMEEWDILQLQQEDSGGLQAGNFVMELVLPKISLLDVDGYINCGIFMQ